MTTIKQNTIQTKEVLDLIHKAHYRLRVNPNDEKLKALTDSAVSVLVIYLRFANPRVYPEQVEVVNRLRMYLESINIHTLATQNNNKE